MPNGRYISFDYISALTLFTNNPDLLAEQYIEPYDHLIIDEFQYTPAGGRLLKYLHDKLFGQLASETKKIVYQLVRPGARSKDYEDAIQWGGRSGLVYQVKRTAKPSIPLSAGDDLSAFKICAMDVGLIRRMWKKDRT